MNQLSLQIRRSDLKSDQKKKKQMDLLKPSTIKHYIFGIFVMLQFLIKNESNTINDCTTLCLALIQLKKYYEGKSFKNVDQFDMMLCCCSFLARIFFQELQVIIISLSFFSLKFNLSTIIQTKSVLKKAKNISLTMIFLLVLISYIFTYFYQEIENTALLYGSFSQSCFTLLEVLTLDSWGSRGRVLEEESGYTGIPSIMICFYVFMINYFYMNILIGQILESLQSQDNRIIDNLYILQDRKKHQIDYFEDYCLGQKYQILIITLSCTSIFFNLLSEQDSLINLINFIISLLYLIHFLLILIVDGPKFEFERQKWERITIHFISGPLGFILNNEIRSICSLLKLSTTPLVRGVLSGTVNIFATLFPGLQTILSIILFVSTIMTQQYYMFKGFKGESYFASISKSFYTFTQILTLDDWNSNVLPIFSEGHYILPYLLIPTFIVISNFILLNILIALSCKYFKEIDYSLCQTNSQLTMQNKPLRNLLQAHINLPKITTFSSPNYRDERRICNYEGFVVLQYGNTMVPCLLI